MNINVTAVPPAPGSADPANLYVDLQSRALWLGVDPAVDPAGAVLISDIVQTQADIAASVVTAKTYTDEQIVTRAPVVHTHTASQITDFNAAVDAAVGDNPAVGFAVGMIVLWSGVISSIGVGALAGWHLCDGTSGTPDLRDRFVIGAGNKTPGPNTPIAFATNSQGSHSHTVGSTSLTLAQTPAHAHTVTSYGGTDSQGSHQHSAPGRQKVTSGGPDNARFEGSGNGPGITLYVDAAGAHTHSVVVSGTTSSVGSNTGHDHTLTSGGAHIHGATQNALRDALSYYALAYIMKIA